MALNLFDQFQTPTLLGIPLILISLIMPWMLFPSMSTRLINNRIISVKQLFIKKISQELFNPLNLKAHSWAALYLSLIMFLLYLNILGLLPYTFTPTTQLSLCLGFAIPFWLSTVMIGLSKQPTVALAHLLPEETPAPLIPALIIIETASLMIRPLALGVRLAANLTAGHLLLQLISSATFYLCSSFPILAMTTMATLLLLGILEIAVAVIQAFVFVLLLSLYLQENT
uniref:ATP synthase subunit a n=1 Tax=Lepidogalaxias salamandroides TaxID=89578 RepID=F1AWF5_9TELE|nr:ATPase subunit 6 [Lepidogalaxias salamandroides]